MMGEAIRCVLLTLEEQGNSVCSNDCDNPAPHFSVETTRRALLRAATGMVLAGGGIYLPAWRSEAEARDGVLAGRLGGRHGENRRGRGPRQNRSRNRHDQQPDRDPPRSGFGGEGILDIKFVVYNDSAEAIDSSCVYYKWATLNTIGHDDKTIPAHGSVEFPTFVKKAGLFLDSDRHFIVAENPFIGYPTVALQSAGRGEAGPKNLAEGEALNWEGGGYKIDIKRETDDADHKIFTIRYRRPV